MSDSSSEQKVFPASQHKLKKLRKQGQFPKSEFIDRPMLSMIPFAFLYFGFYYAVNYSDVTMGYVARTDILVLADNILDVIFWLLLTLFFFLLFQCLFIWVFQSKSVITTEPLQPKISKLNPIKGAKEKFGLSAYFKSGKSVFFLSIFVMVLLYGYGYLDLNGLSFGLNSYYFIDIFFGYTKFLALLVFCAGWTIVCIDYLIEKEKFLRQNKMSITEVRNEYKETEGSPEVKSRQRSLRNELFHEPAGAAMRKQPPTFALANPTHILIPVLADLSIVHVPYICDVFRDDRALATKSEYINKNIPIIENIKLTRAIFSSVGQNKYVELPSDFYADIAKIMVEINEIKKMQKTM